MCRDTSSGAGRPQARSPKNTPENFAMHRREKKQGGRFFYTVNMFHVFFLPINPRCPQSKQARDVLIGGDPCGQIGSVRPALVCARQQTPRCLKCVCALRVFRNGLLFKRAGFEPFHTWGRSSPDDFHSLHDLLVADHRGQTRS